MKKITLAEGFILAAIAAVFFGLASRACTHGPEMKRAAEKEARVWARELGLPLEGLACADVDGDGDGYVSCSVRLRGELPQQIECRGAWSRGHGCREPKLRLPAR